VDQGGVPTTRNSLRIPDPRTSVGNVVTRMVTIRPPGSKSLTNRAVLLAALAQGDSILHGPLLSAQDATVMRAAIEALGARTRVEGDALHITGVNGRWNIDSPTTIHLGNAGTAVRFLAAAAWLSPHPITIDGTPRMRERPIGELGELLSQLDCFITYPANQGFPPVTINPPSSGPAGARTLAIGPTQSGQFISALLLAAAFIPGGLTLTAKSGWTSASYVRMTLALLAKLGASVQASEGLRVLRVQPPAGRSGLAGFTLEIEPDASGATYAWAAGALVPGLTVHVPGLTLGSTTKADSLQGDTDFARILEAMGARVLATETGISLSAPTTKLQGIDADMSDMPDAAMTLAVVASQANSPTTVRGVRTLRVKETDRIAALTNELAKVGTRVEWPLDGDTDSMRVHPGTDPGTPVSFATYDDHRMAMATSLVGLVRPGVTILDPGCVAKTYPTYWDDFAKVLGVPSLA